MSPIHVREATETLPENPAAVELRQWMSRADKVHGLSASEGLALLFGAALIMAEQGRHVGRAAEVRDGLLAGVEMKRQADAAYRRALEESVVG